MHSAGATLSVCYNYLLLGTFSSDTCGSGGTGRHTILRGWRRKAWGFKSPLPHHDFALWNQRSRDLTNASRKRLQNDLSGYRHPHHRLFLHHRRGPAAKRNERRHLRCLWRTGQPDGFRAPRRGQRPLQSDYMVRGGFHAHVHHFIGVCEPANWSKLGAVWCKDDAASEDRTCASPDDTSHEEVALANLACGFQCPGTRDICRLST
jgi:hypothetical protein